MITTNSFESVKVSVYFYFYRGADVDVKRLPKRPAPPRFTRKLTDAQKVSISWTMMLCELMTSTNPLK